MSGRLVAVGVVVVALVVAVAGVLLLDARSARPLPGTPLAIRTDSPAPSGFVCGTAVIPPARLRVAGAALILTAANGGAVIDVAWPAGYAARLALGRGGLYDPLGYLVAADGETIQQRFFGSTSGAGTFHVCRITRD